MKNSYLISGLKTRRMRAKLKRFCRDCYSFCQTFMRMNKSIRQMMQDLYLECKLVSSLFINIFKNLKHTQVVPKFLYNHIA